MCKHDVVGNLRGGCTAVSGRWSIRRNELLGELAHSGKSASEWRPVHSEVTYQDDCPSGNVNDDDRLGNWIGCCTIAIAPACVAAVWSVTRRLVHVFCSVSTRNFGGVDRVHYSGETSDEGRSDRGAED